MYTHIGTAKLNDVDPQAWLADVLDRIAAWITAFSGGLLLWRSDQGESRASISARVPAAPADGRFRARWAHGRSRQRSGMSLPLFDAWYTEESSS